MLVINAPKGKEVAQDFFFGGGREEGGERGYGLDVHDGIIGLGYMLWGGDGRREGCLV